MSGAPIQFRLVEQGDGSGPDELQWRHRFRESVNGLHTGAWGPWEKVERLGFVQAYEADEEERVERRLEDLYGD